jgi:beta-N-acetylhexosaminidase
LRARLPETVLITDDMQMQGLQRALGTRAASLQSLGAGIDMLCIGNNLLNQEQKMAGIAEAVAEAVGLGILDRAAIGRSIERVQKRKALLR